ncbi:MAG: carbohydrate ABC transporter permease [Oligoflexales bacterium]|nr:carbohydrate ABC transporter permease [Oligoflexales bacterium]
MKFKNPAKHFLKLGHYAILSGFALFAVFPILWILLTALKRKEDIFSGELGINLSRLSFDNFYYVLSNNDAVFLTWFKNSFLIALLTSLVCVFLASSAAYGFSRFKFPGRKQGLFLFMLVQMFPGVILIIPLYYIMRQLGLLNSYGGLVLAYASSALPFCVWMLKGFFDTVPRSLEEAARMDGLGSFGIFFRIMVPLALPGFAVTLFFAFITAWNEFMIAMTFMSNESLYTLPVGIQTYVHEYDTDWHLMAAAGILITLPALFVFMRLQPLIISGLTKGATKS